MAIELILVLSYSIAIPALLSIFRWRYTMREFLPFSIYLWLGLANELLAHFSFRKTFNFMYISNIYTLVTWVVLLAQFAIWGRRRVKRYVWILMAGIVVWVFDNIWLHDLKDNNSLFRMFGSVIIVLYSLDHFTKILIYERAPLSKKPAFLICIGFIFFFSCKAFLESFNIFHSGLSNHFIVRIFLILSVVNLFSNFLFAYAILCMPRKQVFTMPY